MKIAVLGAGIIGTTIARRWQERGHEITYGARDPQGGRYRELAAEAAVTDIPSAVAAADAVLIAVPGASVADLLHTNRQVLDGALVLDASNDLSGGAMHHLPLYAEIVPQARVFRAFNTLGWENFAQPEIEGEQADLFYAGPEGTDKTTVERLIADVGLRPIWLGAGSRGADLLDGLTRLWFTLAMGRGHGRHLAFRTLGLSGDRTI